MKLKRLPREYGEPRYYHPHGYIIVREKRSWQERIGRIHGQADPPCPLYSWDVFRGRIIKSARGNGIHVVGGKHVHNAGSHQEACEWADKHSRELQTLSNDAART